MRPSNATQRVEGAPSLSPLTVGQLARALDMRRDTIHKALQVLPVTVVGKCKPIGGAACNVYGLINRGKDCGK